MVGASYEPEADRRAIMVTRTGDAGPNTLVGTSRADFLYGRGGDDSLLGRAGDDFLEGGMGVDTLHGGSGSDTAGYRDARGGVSVDLVTHRSAGAAGVDVLSGIENLDGGRHADTLGGDEGDNRLRGFGGDDGLVGGEGNDVLEGGRGDDWVEGKRGEDALFGDSGRDLVYSSHALDNKEDPVPDDDEIHLGADRDADTAVFVTDVEDAPSGSSLYIGNDTVYDFDPALDVLRIKQFADDDYDGPGTARPLDVRAALDSNEDGRITAQDDDVTRLGADLVLDLPIEGTITIVGAGRGFAADRIESILDPNDDGRAAADDFLL
jgi:Ca2+-binding RTX toxin-like protein